MVPSIKPCKPTCVLLLLRTHSYLFNFSCRNLQGSRTVSMLMEGLMFIDEELFIDNDLNSALILSHIDLSILSCTVWIFYFNICNHTKNGLNIWFSRVKQLWTECANCTGTARILQLLMDLLQSRKHSAVLLYWSIVVYDYLTSTKKKSNKNHNKLNFWKDMRCGT